MLEWNILQYLTKILRQYFDCDEIYEIFDKNIATIFPLQWNAWNISDIFLQYSEPCGIFSS